MAEFKKKNVEENKKNVLTQKPGVPAKTPMHDGIITKTESVETAKGIYRQFPSEATYANAFSPVYYPYEPSQKEVRRLALVLQKYDNTPIERELVSIVCSFRDGGPKAGFALLYLIPLFTYVIDKIEKAKTPEEAVKIVTEAAGMTKGEIYSICMGGGEPGSKHPHVTIDFVRGICHKIG